MIGFGTDSSKKYIDFLVFDYWLFFLYLPDLFDNENSLLLRMKVQMKPLKNLKMNLIVPLIYNRICNFALSFLVCLLIILNRDGFHVLNGRMKVNLFILVLCDAVLFIWLIYYYKRIDRHWVLVLSKARCFYLILLFLLLLTHLNGRYYWDSIEILFYLCSGWSLNSFYRNIPIFFRIIHEFLKFSYLLLLWQISKSKTWLCGVGTIFANADYGASFLEFLMRKTVFFV